MAFKLTNSPYPKTRAERKADRQARRALRREDRKPDAPQLGEPQTPDDEVSPIWHIAGGPDAGYWQKNKDGVKVRVPNPNPGTSKTQTD